MRGRSGFLGQCIHRRQPLEQPFEIIDFKPAKLGTHEVLVRAKSISNKGESIGVAVSFETDAEYE